MKFAIYNPHNKPENELPYIIGFNNGGQVGLMSACAISEDGHFLGSHLCSGEGFMPGDLGCYEGARKDRHEKDYQKHYPEGYRMDFVSYNNVESDQRLKKAFELNALLPEPEAEKEKA